MALRQQVWVDKSVQGVLVGRVLLYWACGMLYVGIGSACFQYHQNPEWTLSKHALVLFDQMWPWLPTAILLLPLTIYDVVRLSNLFVGPVYRLRRHFAKLREDIACAPLTFREDDHWRDLTAPINDMQAEILRLRSGVIELQQAAAHTSALMADFRARLPAEPEPDLPPESNLQSAPDAQSALETDIQASSGGIEMRSAMVDRTGIDAVPPEIAPSQLAIAPVAQVADSMQATNFETTATAPLG